MTGLGCSSSEGAFGGSKGRRAAGQSTHGGRHLSSTPLALYCALISLHSAESGTRDSGHTRVGKRNSPRGGRKWQENLLMGRGVPMLSPPEFSCLSLGRSVPLSPPPPSDISPFDPSECLLQVRFLLALISSPVTHSPSTPFSPLSSDRTPPTRTHTPQHPRFFSLASYLTL